MKAILTSSLGGSIKAGGKRIPIPLMDDNGQLDKIKAFWRENSKILLISGTPDDYGRNDGMINCLKESFRMSGLFFRFFELCDPRTEELAERLGEMDVILLGGGHVPTQNAFMEHIRLKERLRKYEGLIIGWSAGSMNCAEIVYAGPESEGEAIDPNYQRWISGLGLTRVNVLPHFQSLKGDILDGLRLIEDITYADSIGHEIIALNDGSYIVIDGDIETLYGEAYSIKDGCRKQICKNGESVILENR
ncbi:MAG: Type 1 glutamine amidotransferase-like domain-containing protein [Acetatifactor sp.]|nr:Type 1 glutamine amidotransferase-like domain-containing protein [Acetatifactor sp.]